MEAKQAVAALLALPFRGSGCLCPYSQTSYPSTFAEPLLFSRLAGVRYQFVYCTGRVGSLHANPFFVVPFSSTGIVSTKVRLRFSSYDDAAVPFNVCC